MVDILDSQNQYSDPMIIICIRVVEVSDCGQQCIART